MQNRSLIILGTLIILWGIALVISNLLDINVWKVCFPTLLILAGIWLLAGPRLNLALGTNVKIHPLADIRRTGAWVVGEEELWTFVGDTRLDFSEAEIPLGETRIRLVGFVGNIRLKVPQNLGYRIESMAFLNEARIEGVKKERFVSTLSETSENYGTEQRKIILEMLYFVADLRVERI